MAMHGKIRKATFQRVVLRRLALGILTFAFINPGASIHSTSKPLKKDDCLSPPWIARVSMADRSEKFLFVLSFNEQGSTLNGNLTIRVYGRQKESNKCIGDGYIYEVKMPMNGRKENDTMVIAADKVTSVNVLCGLPNYDVEGYTPDHFDGKVSPNLFTAHWRESSTLREFVEGTIIFRKTKCS